VPARVGGFGGAAGLEAWLRREGVTVLVDATHPFAARITANAAVAARAAGVPLIALRRPAWQRHEGDRWREVGTVAEAVAALGPAPCRVFVALGRQELAPLLSAPQHFYLVRSVDPVEPPLALPSVAYLLARGPFVEDGEEALFRRHRIDAVLAKNSGGDATYAKLAAARALGAIALVCGIILMLGAASGGTDPLRPLAQFAQRGTQAGPGRELVFASVGSAPELKARLGAAGGRPTLVYFTADWCVTCRVIERSVLPDPSVADGLATFQLVKADLSDFNDDNAALMRAMRVAGPPTMVFFDAAGSEVAKTRLIGSVTVDSLTRSAAAAREP
jgi:precorrin-6x reductase